MKDSDQLRHLANFMDFNIYWPKTIQSIKDIETEFEKVIKGYQEKDFKKDAGHIFDKRPYYTDHGSDIMVLNS